MKLTSLFLMGFILISCASHQDSREFEMRVNAQTARNLSQVEKNLKELLSMHSELTEEQKEKISQRLRQFIATQKTLREREQRLLEIGLGDAIYASEASMGHWKREVTELYEQKAENTRSTVKDIHDLTRDPPVEEGFYHEFPFLMREVR